ncbi:Inner membrane permease YgbN [Paraglaciecola mesophila]|uniref:Inner membrane permease YgbN n=1 Tax=Paraglaciecola mesophila TaxID=197222 RepID=A0A857JFL7_9ALTE|nr:GntP family permease [Paraglaciecola mesophila]QHJ10466.1 Inner membrane permease YgbN [Paraglaciecola mesophila]
MQNQPFIHEPWYLLIVALGAVLALLFLIVRVRIHAFIALSLVSLVTALVAGISVTEVVPTLMGSFGGTLASVALLVGLGAMIGKLLEVSGGAQVLAENLVNRFGQDKAPLALGIASLCFGFPIFFDAGLIVMMPIIFSVAHRFNGSVLTYALPAAGAFAVMHAFVPPHPGPVAAAEFLGADISLLLLIGLVIAAPTWYLGAYIFGQYAGKRFGIPLHSLFSQNGSNLEEDKARDLPSFSSVMLILLLPVCLIFMDTGLNTLIAANVIQGDSGFVHILRLLGKTPVALLITLLVTITIFSRRFGMHKIEQWCGDSLAPICAVILVTGAGGMFGGVLRASGIGDALAGLLADTGMPIIVAGFIISASLRVAQGSATVALTTTAALLTPMVAMNTGLSAVDLCCLVIAIAGGATVLSHFNDSGFWLVSRLLNMDEKTTLKTWTVMETLLGSLAFIFALCISLIF